MSIPTAASPYGSGGTATSRRASRDGPVEDRHRVDIRLVDGEGYQRVERYPEQARTEREEDGGLIVRNERTGKPFTPSYQVQLHRRIRREAELPDDLEFTSFRHGGITELGDRGEIDVRAVSGHKTLNITGIYNKTTDEKARRIAAGRRAHTAAITAG